ncbi:MAG: efflux RND transporter periplasmic adaptor subunit [Planctomycetota bacterium]|jgi:multidrug resistance efflux pump
MRKSAIKYLVTGVVVIVAVVVLGLKYRDYVFNPWTRNGQVQATVIQITPRVSGPIVSLPIVDNQFVNAGETLFEIDPRTYQAEVAQAQAQLQQANVEVDDARDEADRGQRLRDKDKGAISEQEVISRQNALRAAQATALAAEAALQEAELNLEFTTVKAPVDGYVTNLNLRLGSQAVVNQPALALVDVNSYWVYGFFKETSIKGIARGDHAVVTLMSYPDTPLNGRVDSLGWGIAQDDGSTGPDLLPNIAPTFEWIRLAQRVPVLIHLDEVPDEVTLRVGTTASVLVRKGTADDEIFQTPVAAPRPLE